MQLVQKTCIVLLVTGGLAASVQAADFPAEFRLDYLGQQIVPTGAIFNDTTVGGLSSLDYDKERGQYLAISDNRSNIDPARFYGLSLDLEKFRRSAAPGHAGVTFNSVISLQTADGSTFSANTVDPEGLRFDPMRNRLYWSNEGQRSGAGYQAPTVREMNIDGS